MADKFKAGDVIKLKLGGRSMTVKGHASKHTADGNIPIADKYECFWMDGAKLQKAIFQEDAIMLMENKNS